MSVNIRFESRERDEDYTLGPFDWIEIDGNIMVAEAQNGAVRHEELAALCQAAIVPNDDSYRPMRWETEDGRRWNYFVIYTTKAPDTPLR